jgi:hypothetical protein
MPRHCPYYQALDIFAGVDLIIHPAFSCVVIPGLLGDGLRHLTWNPDLKIGFPLEFTQHNDAGRE